MYGFGSMKASQGCLSVSSKTARLEQNSITFFISILFLENRI